MISPAGLLGRGGFIPRGFFTAGFYYFLKSKSYDCNCKKVANHYFDSE
jgi:hypothetical protein